MENSDTQTILNEIKAKRGSVANIHTEFQDYPQGMKAHFDFYETIMLNEGPLPRDEREWLAVETSVVNECSYCFRHHQTAFEMAQAKLNRELMSDRQEQLSLLAVTLTKKSFKTSVLKEDFLAVGFTEAEWQHAIMIVSYFNFVNRLAHAQSLELESNFELSCQ